MPFRVFASPSRQIDELTGPSPQYEKKTFAPPVSEDVANKSEYALDFQGRKHLDREASDEKYQFGPREDASPTLYSEIPMPGLASADTLRDFLRQHLQPYQVVDEYGDECDLSDISNDHLPVLQAKVWMKVSNNHSPVKTPVQSLSRTQVLVAGHVAKISQLLEEKHIFLLSKDTKNDTCNYLSDLQVSPKHACYSQIVRVEPLVHWGTVTPASPSHYILPFRRDGELMREPDKPEFKLLVSRIFDTDAPAYCVDCLGYLWNKRAEARETMRQLQSTVPPPQSRGSEDTAPPRPILKLKKSGAASGDAITLAVGGAVGTEVCYSKPAESELQGHYGEALPQLDGASDSRAEAQLFLSSSNGQGNNATWISSDNDELIEKHTGRARPLQRIDSFTLPLRPTSLTPKRSSGVFSSCAPPSRPPSSVALKVSSTPKDSRQAGFTTAKGKCGPQVIDQTTSPRAKERKFGRELDANTRAPLVQVRRSPRRSKTDMFKSQENRPPPVKLTKPWKPIQKTKAAPKETKKRKASPLSEQTSKRKNARAIAPKSSKHRTRTGITPKEPAPLQSELWIGSTAGLQHVPESGPTIRSSSPPKLIVRFAKRLSNVKVPDGISTLEWEACQNMEPDATSKICWCNKPASHGAFKKNDIHIEQCTDKSCRFRWFHYACLNVSEKGQARFNNLLCLNCRIKQDFAEQDRRNEWSVEKLLDIQMGWSRGDTEAQMPGLGGVIPRANPYRLGREVQLRPKYESQIKETGTLGGLERLGYVQSRPKMLERAYLRADAYAELLARRAEDEGSEWMVKTRAAEEDYR